MGFLRMRESELLLRIGSGIGTELGSLLVLRARYLV
jgi:hypothetical protein